MNPLRLTRGDVDATVAQVGFNLAQVVIPVFLLAPAGIPRDFSIARLLPGYALGYLAGSFGMVWLAMNLARKQGRADVTAHVYGNNVPAILAYSLSIVLPVYLQTHDSEQAWATGAAAVTWTGFLKLAAAPFCGALRRFIPAPATMTVFGAAMYSYLALILLQRIFDQPFVGIVALAIVAVGVLGRVPITKWRIPPFLAAWLLPVAVSLAIGYVHPGWPALAATPPFAGVPAPLHAMALALPFLSVIVPIAVYQVLQDIAAVEGASAAGDDYSARAVVAWDGVGTLVAGMAGSAVSPVVYAIHPPYKAMGARIGYASWSPVLYMMIVAAGLTTWIAQLFPWSILAAMIAYIAIGVGTATLHRVDRKYLSAVLLGFVLPAGAVVSSAINAALPALKLQAANPTVAAALNGSIYWSSVQGLGNGFLLLVLVVSALVAEIIDRRFARAALWCLIAAGFAWFGMMHSASAGWGAQPVYAAGWATAAVVVYSARWWHPDALNSDEMKR